MAGGKWVAGLTPETPTADAARAALDARLGAVRHRFARAGKSADAVGVGTVHKLRVAARRAAAAVDAFAPVLGKRAARKARRAIKAARRSAEHVRDWDVFGAWLQSAAGESPGAAVLLGYAAGRRAAAAEAFQLEHRDARHKLERACDKLPDAVDAAEIEPLADYATPAVAAPLDALTLAANDPPNDAEGLHNVRIVAKRARYALELFAACFVPAFTDALIPAVARVQEALGAVQDAAVATDRLAGAERHLAASRPELAAGLADVLATLRAGLAARTDAGRTAFRAWADAWPALVAAHPLEALGAADGSKDGSSGAGG